MNRTYIQTSCSGAAHGSCPVHGSGAGADADPGSNAEVGAGNAAIESCSESQYFDEANSTEESDSGSSRYYSSYSGKTFGNLKNKVKNTFKANLITDLLIWNDKEESIFTVVQASIPTYFRAPLAPITGSIISSASKSVFGGSSALKLGSGAPSDQITGSVCPSASKSGSGDSSVPKSSSVGSSVPKSVFGSYVCSFNDKF